jgi:hypothetical protein
MGTAPRSNTDDPHGDPDLWAARDFIRSLLWRLTAPTKARLAAGDGAAELAATIRAARAIGLAELEIASLTGVSMDELRPFAKTDRLRIDPERPDDLQARRPTKTRNGAPLRVSPSDDQQSSSGSS